MAKIGTNGVFNLNFQVAPSGGRWVSLELILEVMEAMPGSVVPLAMFFNKGQNSNPGIKTEDAPPPPPLNDGDGEEEGESSKVPIVCKL